MFILLDGLSVDTFLNLLSKAENIKVENGIVTVETNGGAFKSRFVVNVAGLYSDIIASMTGDLSNIETRRGVENISNTIVATGFRVKNVAETGILGDRPSGIYSFHFVVDILHAGLKPSRNIVIYGLNKYSLLLAEKLLTFAKRVRVADPAIPEDLRVPSEIEVIKGKVSYVEGAYRLSAVVVKGEPLEADTLILAMFKPWNPFPEYPVAGHVALEVYSLEAFNRVL